MDDEALFGRSSDACCGGCRGRRELPRGGKAVQHRREQRCAVGTAVSTDRELSRWGAIAIRVSRTSETGCSLGSLRRLICRFMTSDASLPRAMSTPAMARSGGFSPRRRSPLKKIVSAAEQDRPDIAAGRMCWREGQKQLEAKRLVFIDETWVKTNMAPTHGRCRRGQRLYAKVPHGHWKTTTFVAALRHDGIPAPFVLDGPINGECFLAYVETVLVPTLSPGDIVLIDNLGSHKSPKIRKAIEAKGAELHFLPRYSPDLNPIEMAFSKLKTLLRKASERSVEALWSRIGELLSHFPRHECQNYFRAAGYEPT
jgi:transposase